MADVHEDRMRAELQTILQGVDDLTCMSIGKLRASLELALDLLPGALDARKDQVNRVLQEELVKKVQEDQQPVEEKKRKAETPKEPPAKKEKPAEKKEKKDKSKKDKKEKKEDKAEKKKAEEEGSGEEALEAEDVAPAEPPPVPEAPAASEQQPEPAAEAAAEAVAGPAKDVTMGISAFEDLSVATPQKKGVVARLQTWAVSGAEDGHLRLWDLESYSCVRVLEGHAGTVRALSVDWEDMQALSGADDNVRLWNLKRGGCLKTFSDVEDGCAAVAADWKNLKALGGCGDGQLKLWSMTSGELLSSVAAHPGGVWAVEAKWEERRVASGGDEQFKVWDIVDWSCLHKIEGHPGGIMCLSVDWDGQRVLVGVGAAEQSLRLWDLETRKPRNLLGHRDAVAHVRADWEGDVCLSGGWDAQLRIWSLAKGSCVQSHDCKFGRIRSVSVDFSQMQAICGSSAGTLHFVDLHSGMDLRKLEGHVGGVTALQAKF